VAAELAGTASAGSPRTYVVGKTSLAANTNGSATSGCVLGAFFFGTPGERGKGTVNGAVAVGVFKPGDATDRLAPPLNTTFIAAAGASKRAESRVPSPSRAIA
jgi:hypothetical protein